MLKLNNSLKIGGGGNFLELLKSKVPQEFWKNFSATKTPAQTVLFRSQSRFAFTLAETLINLGIIGVVAAITIPNLIANNKAHRLRAQFLKSYTTIQQVVLRMQDDEISLDPKDYKDGKSGRMYLQFKKYMNAPIDCGDNGTRKSHHPCYYSTGPYKNLKGTANVSNNWLDDGQIALLDGTLFLFENANANDYVWVHVDLNGHDHPPNKYGYDLFVFQVSEGQLRTMGDSKSMYNDLDKYCSLSSNDSKNGIACAQKAKENPDYFKWAVKNIK